MRFRHIVALAFAAVLLVATTALATAQLVAVDPVTPKVMTGGEIGVRVEGLRGGTPVGSIVVDIDGEWVAVELNAFVPQPAGN